MKVGVIDPRSESHLFLLQAHLIAQSIGQAFQVAYMEFLKANGIDEPNIQLKDTSYEDILEQQEIMNDELETFTRKDKNKEVLYRLDAHISDTTFCQACLLNQLLFLFVWTFR